MRNCFKMEEENFKGWLGIVVIISFAVSFFWILYTLE